MRKYFSDFPWNDYCFGVRDPTVCAKHITKVIVSAIEVIIPHTLSTPNAKITWFNHACSRAIKDREVAFRRYQSLPAPDNHALYISA